MFHLARLRFRGIYNARDHVSQQLLVFVLSAYYNQRVRHALVLLQRRFNLCGFNSIAANFHLVIGTPHIFQQAVCAPARKVARAVHSCAWLAKWICNKTFRR